MSDYGELNLDLTEPFPHLQRAPIVEAVIHWQARAAEPAEHDSLRQLLTERLPAYADAKPIRAVRFAAQIGAEGVAASSKDEFWTGWRLTSADGRDVVQFNTDGLVVSRLAPYESWTAFSGEAQRLWKVYLDIAHPSEIQRLGVRFINRITPVAIDEVQTLLQRPPVRLKSLGLPVHEFLYQSSHNVPGYPYRLNIVDTIQPEISPEVGGPALILDIDAFTTRSIGLGDAEMNDHLQYLHWLKNKAFFSLLSESAIARFKEET